MGGNGGGGGGGGRGGGRGIGDRGGRSGRCGRAYECCVRGRALCVGVLRVCGRFDGCLGGYVERCTITATTTTTRSRQDTLSPKRLRLCAHRVVPSCQVCQSKLERWQVGLPRGVRGRRSPLPRGSEVGLFSQATRCVCVCVCVFVCVCGGGGGNIGRSSCTSLSLGRGNQCALMPTTPKEPPLLPF